MKNRWGIVLAAGLLAGMSAAGSGAVVYASDEIRIIGESEEETASLEEAAGESAEEGADAATAKEGSEELPSEQSAPEGSEEMSSGQDTLDEHAQEEGGSAQSVRDEAETAARLLYTRLQESADLNDNETFSSLFAGQIDPAVIQSQLQAIKSSLNVTSALDKHSDFCFLGPDGEDQADEAACAVSLTDYQVTQDGGVNWYATLLRVEKDQDEWKVSSGSVEDLLGSLYPEDYTDAAAAGYNAVDLYPYFAMRFDDDAVFDGAFYSLINMVWQNSDASVTFALWLSNGQGGTKWCDSIEVVLTDSVLGTVADVRIPVQTAVSGNASSFLQYTIPAESVRTGTQAWTALTVRSNLIYE